jgi:excisionase family DNA binding protein
MATAAAPRLLTTREVARILRVHPKRVHQLVAGGTLHPIQLVEGGRFRFLVEEIERLIAGEGAP